MPLSAEFRNGNKFRKEVVAKVRFERIFGQDSKKPKYF